MANIENAKWANAQKTLIIALVDGEETTFPPTHRFAKLIVGDPVDFEASLPTVVDIKAEANARIISLVPEWKQRNLIAQASQLSMKKASGGELTVFENEAWAAGEIIWGQVNSIRAASDELELLLEAGNIPENWRDDIHWTVA